MCKTPRSSLVGRLPPSACISSILARRIAWRILSAVRSRQAAQPCEIQATEHGQGRSRIAHAGPVDGPAIFDNVKGCHISVAAQQLQVRGSQDSEFAVYSANKPTIEHSAGASTPLLVGRFPACQLLRHVHK